MISRFTFKKGPRVFEVLVAKNWTSSKLKEVKIKTENAFPIFLEEDDFKKGADVFALDFLVMRNEYKLLEGEDTVLNIEINKEDLRRALETEVRRLLASARQAYFKKISLDTEDIVVTLTGLVYGLEYLNIKEIDQQSVSSVFDNFLDEKKIEVLLEILEKIEKIVDKK